MEYQIIEPDEFEIFIRLQTARNNKGYFIEDNTRWIASVIEDLHQYRERNLYLHIKDANYKSSIIDDWYSNAERMTSEGVRYLVYSDVDIDITKSLMVMYKKGLFRKHILIGGKW